MWIIPKNSPIYPSAQATGALISDLKELSDLCEQSVMWRSKTSSSTTWLRRLKRTSSTTVLSTQTLKHSLGNSLVAEWTSSVEASLANHFQQQEEEKEVKTHDICGLTSQMESSDWGDLPLFSSRMSRGSSAPNSKGMIGQTQREHLFCSMSLESWKGWVTKQRQAYSQRVKSVRPINESESLYLVSEMISDKKVLISSMDSSNEMIQSLNWATPRANKTSSENYETWKKRADKGQVSTMPLTLQVEVQHGPHQEDKNNTGTNHQELRWATPNTMDHLTPKSQETLMRQATTVRKGRKAPSNLREQVDPVAMEVYEQANWGTPMTGEMSRMGSSIEYYIRRQNIGKQVDLNGQVMLQNWTTPIARDCFEIEMNHQIPNRKDGKHRLDTMPRQIHHQENYRGKLNPRWVEMLMGLPIGWTMPSCTNPVTIEQMNLGCLEMESCQIQLQEHLESFGENWATPTSVDYKQISMSEKCLKNRIASNKQVMLPTQVHLIEQSSKSWATPTTRDYKGYYSLENQKLKPRNLLPDQAYQETIKNNWPTPNTRDYKDTLNTVPPCINQTRGYSLGQALAEELKKDKE